MKLIEADKLIAEIEKLKAKNTEAFDCGCDGTKCAGYDMAIDDVLSFINSMREEHCRIWRKFSPSNDLPKERVSIAYDTHDERGVRYSYGCFQFRNGTCIGFWKDGNEQPKFVKAEDIRYWIFIQPFEIIQLDLVNEDLEEEYQKFIKSEWFDNQGKHTLSEFCHIIAHHFAEWQKKKDIGDLLMSDYRNFAKCYDQGVSDTIEQMMMYADEGYIRRNKHTKTNVLHGFSVTSEQIQKFKDHDKVKILVVKEE